MFVKNSLFVVLLLLLISFKGFAQFGSNNPYTSRGIGEVLGNSSMRNLGMSNMGVSSGNVAYLNQMNPALLVYNKYTVFEAIYTGEYSTLTTKSAEQNDMGANLRNIAFAFPVNTRWWTMGIGLRPLTNVNYSISLMDTIAATPSPAFVKYALEGDGGISQVYFSNGFYIGKGLSLGLEIAFNFGAINKKETSQLMEPSAYEVGEFTRTNYTKFTFKPGIQYSLKVAENKRVNIGATYDFKTDFNSKYLASRQIRLQDIVKSSDTTAYNTKGAVTMPSGYVIGASFEQTGKFVVGADFEWRKWSEYVDADGNGDLSDTYRLSVGGEYTPDYSSVSNYLKRMTFRAGFKYEQMPWAIGQEQLEDLSGSLGISFPMAKGFSSINLAGAYGNMDSKGEVPIKKEYFKFHLGITINTQWFYKRAIE
ncbi:hypothetical protein AAG747_02390 [Rapidithrix thailandica]|uniref:Long-chain fatty acid transport protein n=1 Tax=Rapidithrix thailandica TaxID=413964 RepID=A0AAW9S2X5_9BACT